MSAIVSPSSLRLNLIVPWEAGWDGPIWISMISPASALRVRTSAPAVAIVTRPSPPGTTAGRAAAAAQRRCGRAARSPRRCRAPAPRAPRRRRERDRGRARSAPRASIPFERTLAPDVREPERQHEDEERHLGEPEEAELAE